MVHFFKNQFMNCPLVNSQHFSYKNLNINYNCLLIVTETKNDKSISFDFTGTYTAVKENELVEYDMDGNDGFGGASRHVKVKFEEIPEGIGVIETFDPENENSLEMQRSGWQAILDNFKKFTIHAL